MDALLYDGSFEGFLTCVFICYDQKLMRPSIYPAHLYEGSFFESPREVVTEPEKAARVWKGLKSKTTSLETTRVYYAFLSEEKNVENVLLQAIQYVFEHGRGAGSDFSHPQILKISQLYKSVSRERHRMTAFVRFKLTHDGIYFANIVPDFNVLPLISKHFKDRYADQKWIIYDLKRNYGLYYDLNKVDIIQLNFKGNYDPSSTPEEMFTESEIEFQQLWKNYFKSVNIEERKNTRLHEQHVPRRYWKYLSEKQP